jgi:pyruvate formate-lyase/glycerol dehydratase family glycyl radical enzyme
MLRPAPLTPIHAREASASCGTPSPVLDSQAASRLERLREALLDAPYSLCTQKAELLTEWFRANRPPSRLTGLVSPVHFRAQRRTMARTFGEGVPQSRVQLAAAATLQRLYLAMEDEGDTVLVSFARGLEHVLEKMELRIHDDELLVGNLSSQRIGAPIHPDFGGLLLLPELHTLASRPVNPLRTTPEQIRRLEEEVFPYWFTRSVLARAPLLARDPALANTLMRGRDFILTQFAGISHVTPDYPTVLERGFEGILEDIAEAKEGAVHPEQRVFYEAAEIAARAAIAYGARWSRHCEAEAARASEPKRGAELRELAAVFEQVPARPSRTFHEALQSLFLTHVIVHQESFQHGVSFGRIDQYLAPYYEADLEAGRITPSHAVELLGCFLAKAAEQLPLFNVMATEFFSGLSSASGLTLGGTDAAGRDATNDVTFLVLEAYDRMRLLQPNLHLRLHEHTPQALRDAACEILKKGGGMPAFFSDEGVVPAIEALGVAPEHARDYAIVGCVEWGVPRRSFPAAGAAFVSLPAILDDVLHAGPTDVFADMPSLQKAFVEALCARVEAAVAGNDAIEEAHRRFRPTPLLSTLVDGCVLAGRDVTAGGARYDSTGMQGVGLADVADSLAAIEQVVFEEGRLSLPALVAAIDRDFEGDELLRMRLSTKVARYGEDRGRAEYWAATVAAAWCEAVRRHRNPRGGPYAPGFWTMTTHVGFGARLGALPSGRRARRPLADGISPVNGGDRLGPTASMRAAAAIPGRLVANGFCLNEKVDPWFVAGPEGTALLDSLLRGYFQAGGLQLQVNIVDPDVLLDAKAHPDRHRDLVVRISGYSAYFNDLTEEMKDDIIARTQHGLDAAGVAGRRPASPACQATGTATGQAIGPAIRSANGSTIRQATREGNRP